MNHEQTLNLVRTYLSETLNPIADKTHIRYAALTQFLMNVTHYQISEVTLNSNDLIARFCRRVSDQEFCLMLMSPSLIESLEILALNAEEGGDHTILPTLCSYLSNKKFPLTWKEYEAELAKLPGEKQVEAHVFADGHEMDLTPADLLRYRAVAELAGNREMANAYVHRTMGAYDVFGALVGVSESDFYEMINGGRLSYRLASASTPEQVAEDIDTLNRDRY